MSHDTGSWLGRGCHNCVGIGGSGARSGSGRPTEPPYCGRSRSASDWDHDRAASRQAARLAPGWRSGHCSDAGSEATHQPLIACSRSLRVETYCVRMADTSTCGCRCDCRRKAAGGGADGLRVRISRKAKSLRLCVNVSVDKAGRVCFASECAGDVEPPSRAPQPPTMGSVGEGCRIKRPAPATLERGRG